MPTYSYVCPGCEARSYLARCIADRDNPAICRSCGTPLKRVPDGTQGLLTRSREDTRSPVVGMPRRAGPTLTNCGAYGCGGAAIAASGGHLNIRNFTAVDNEGPAFELSNGATVDVDGIIHLARKSPESPKPKRSRKKHGRRGKRR